ncbi:MAG: right-handed parallel beta-helix repeat-containing protein [Ignavibacteria bacterium]|nr:right-handed parallel beta-helix repeat-containing protein [Ignavibacteria bacterium]
MPIAKVTFDRSGSTGTWGSITFDGSPASNSILDNVQIMYASDVQCLNGADVTIQNSLIKDCTQGIYIYNSQPQILNNQITEPTQNGIYGEASGKRPLIQGNVITKTASNPQYKQFQGIIFGNNTRPFITNNDISGFYHAVYLGGGTYTYLTNDSYVTSDPNNRLRNSRYGLNTGWGSTTVAGLLTYGGLGGANSIYNNSTFDVYSYQSSTVVAELNYWGGGQPNYYADGSSSLSFIPYLGSDPWELPSTPISNQQEVRDLDNSVPGSRSDLVSSPSSNVPDLLAGIILERDGRISEAVLHYKQMVNRNVFVRPVLTSLVSIANKYDRSDLLNYFKEMSNNRTELKQAC